MEPFMIMDSNKIIKTRCLVVGFGSSGNCVISLMESKLNSNIELIGMDEAIEKIEEKLQGVDIVFVTGGLGSQVGETIAPIIAKMAKDVNALSIGVVTRPFSYEGIKRVQCAENTLQVLKKVSDSVIVIQNDKLLSIMDTNIGGAESFKIVNSVLAYTIEGIMGVIFASGDNDINIDFMDLKTIMSHQGLAIAGFGESQGEKAASDAIKKAVELANIKINPIKNVSGILVHFTMHPEFHFMKLSEAMEIIQKSVNPSADVIFGTTTDKTLPIDFIRVTFVATGLEKKYMVAANNI
jgi:cell division protein FtsZ